MALDEDHGRRMGAALLALDGLSVGDAFGERFFGHPFMVRGLIAERALPAPPWRYTDDTVMALSIVEVLERHGRIDKDELARAFGRRYRADKNRGYGGTAHDILAAIADGVPWHEIAPSVFAGQGSMGNGGAMRVAPIGAYFSDDLERVVSEARASAIVTHAHPEGQAGAIAVAVAVALAKERLDGPELLRRVIALTPAGPTRDGLQKAVALGLGAAVYQAAEALGTGERVTAEDTVPFALWCAARHLDNYAEAMWSTVAGLGDRDTTCAIAGGVVVMATGREMIPTEWITAREPLDLAHGAGS